MVYCKAHKQTCDVHKDALQVMDAASITRQICRILQHVHQPESAMRESMCDKTIGSVPSEPEFLY